jgi:S1-C subfamily serine protease
MPLVRLLVALALALVAVPLAAADDAGARAARHLLRAATVDLPSGCSGALAETAQTVVTAYHCVDDAERSVRVQLSTGETRTGWIAATDEAADQAVLFLEQPAGVIPLAVARRRQVPGTILYFAGRPSAPRFQEARLERLGRCPSLPALPNALFTSIDGRPGDSGAPVVDAAGRIVGLVHGGAHCHIATPADTLLRLLDEVLGRDLVQLTSVPIVPPPPGRALRPVCRAGFAGRSPPAARGTAAPRSLFTRGA